MRITRSMMMDNMAYWASKQKEKLNDVSTVVASGKEVNKPSDDPSAMAQILKDRVTISEYGQYESNIEQAETWIEVSNETLDTVNTCLQEVQDILSSLSSDEDASEDYMETLESIYKQVLSLANSKYGSAYMYAGNQSDAVPFSNSVEVSGGASSDILFDLAGEASDLTIEIADSTGTVVRTLTVTGGEEGTNTITWDGRDDDGNLLADGDYTFTVSAANEDGDAVASYPTYRGDEGGKIVRTGEGGTMTLNNDGGEIFSEALKVLSRVMTALDSTDDSTAVLSGLYEDLDDVISGIEAGQVTLANQNSQLENSADRLDQLTEFITERLADLEDADTTEAAVELEAQETAYEVTLEATATILNMPKLSDYL